MPGPDLVQDVGDLVGHGTDGLHVGPAHVHLRPADTASRRPVRSSYRGTARTAAYIPVFSTPSADALLDDVGTALDDVPPAEEYQQELAERLRGHLMRLVDFAIGGDADVKDATAFAMIERARDVRSEAMPGDPRRAVGHLRRMAWTVNELLERLLATRQLTKVDTA
ncbi:DUF6415 family natural product biosynthesis protein [Streptomyces sp. NPDC051064]|uniref:DUF6415 family natural product biosynthesis protein n=1 Tax=Streptomyces sp. NPDC051064 TaxID=3365641 RepID=UPI00379358A2